MSFDPRLWHINQDLTPLNLTAFSPKYVPVTRKEQRAISYRRRAFAYLCRQSQRNLRRRVRLSAGSMDVPFIKSALRAIRKLALIPFGQPLTGSKMACFPVYGAKYSSTERVRYIWPGTQIRP